jgi:hypothetical protein
MKAARTKQKGLVPVKDFLDEEAARLDPSALLDAVVEIGQARAKILVAMKAALVRGDNDEAVERARELTGLPSKRPPNRIGPAME